MPDLTIYVNGPSAADVKVFIEWNEVPYRIGLLQRFFFTVSTESFLPRVDMSLPCLNLFDEEPPEITDDTVRIVLEDAVSLLEGLEAHVKSGCKVFSGKSSVGLLRSVSLEATAGASNHVLILEFAKGVNDGNWTEAMIDQLPDWVTVRGMSKEGKEAPPIIKYGEGFTGEWKNTEYSEEKKKEDDEEDE